MLVKWVRKGEGRVMLVGKRIGKSKIIYRPVAETAGKLSQANQDLLTEILVSEGLSKGRQAEQV